VPTLSVDSDKVALPLTSSFTNPREFAPSVTLIVPVGELLSAGGIGVTIMVRVIFAPAVAGFAFADSMTSTVSCFTICVRAGETEG
jgi:hypothetical protein